MRKLKFNPVDRFYMPFDYVEKVNVKIFEKSRTDQTFSASNKSLMQQFLATGQMLSTRQKLQYDFADGKDDGKPLDITRSNPFGAEAPEISTAMANEQDRLEDVQTTRIKNNQTKEEMIIQSKKVIEAIQQQGEAE